MGIEYKSCDYRLFIDSSKRSLKGVLLHNMLQSLPLIQFTWKKHTKNQATFYSGHKWVICGDLKVIGILLGLQKGYTKMPCFLCEWYSRNHEEHWKRKKRKPRKNLKPGMTNIQFDALVPTEKVLLPPLHIKLGLIKQLNTANFSVICEIHFFTSLKAN